MQARSLWEKIEPLLVRVERPSRYINHEYHAACALPQPPSEPQEPLPYRVALLYPDTYELGQSNQAIGILYDLINSQQGFAVERVFLPWVDMIALMRNEGIPLFTLENTAPVASFDLLGITLPHELAATNILEALDLAGIPLRSKDRTACHPIILAGGPVAFNPEPLAAFIDAFVIGEGEEVLIELVRKLRDCKQKSLSRREALLALGGIKGVYVPSFYEFDGTGALAPTHRQLPAVIQKRVIKDFATLPVIANPVVPYAEVAHDRLTLEIQRGCSRGCRFCQAGMIYRPVRERTADGIISAAACGLVSTGYGEVSLLSLSSTDHSQIQQILQRLNHLVSGTGISVSIPSQRLDAFGVEMAQLVAGERKAGLTFAPEAGTQALRDRINKNVTEDDLIEAVQRAFEAGWRRCKLYFMIGLPGETDDDVRGIAEMSNRAYRAAKDAVPDSSRGAVRMSISVAVFIPKPHTPFQWEGQIALDEVRRRIGVLRAAGLHKGIDLHWHDPAASRIEAALSRAGREAADLLEQAWRLGALFDAWSEQFNEDFWLTAAQNSGLDLSVMAERCFEIDDVLAWDHIDSGVSKKFLVAEYARSQEGATSWDCSFEDCISCGACGHLGVRIQLGGEKRV